MGAYGGSHPVDSSDWKQPVASVNKDGEAVPVPAPMEQDENGMKRSATPDPYANGGNGSTRRNFGRG